VVLDRRTGRGRPATPGCGLFWIAMHGYQVGPLD
jgi:hypothetical protein